MTDQSTRTDIGTRTQEFDPVSTAKAHVLRRAAQFAIDQQSDSPAPGDWNAACRHIGEKLSAGESEKPQGAASSSTRSTSAPTMELEAEVSRLKALINSPETDDFDKGAPLECAHQVERWGEPHDRSKSAENWYWLVGYLAGKALRAAIVGDREKALHHTISAAAALRNWHKAIKQDATGAGIGQDEDLETIAKSQSEFKR